MFRTRSQQRTLAWLALIACLSSIVLPGFEIHPAGLADDAACRLVLGSDDDLTRVAASDPSEHPADHCEVCHLQRALRGAFASETATLTLPILSASLAGLTRSVPSAAALDAPTSRGPPPFLNI